MALDPSLITSVLSNWQTPDPYAAFAKIQALKNGIVQQQAAQQKLQSGALQLQQEQQAQQDQQALDAAYRGAITTDPNGNISYDRAKVLSSVPGHLAPGIQKTLNEMDQAKATLDETQAKAKTDQANLVGSLLVPIMDANYDPDVFKTVVTHAAGTGALDPHQAAAFLQQLGPNPTPDAVKTAITPFLAAPAVQDLLTKRATAKAAQERATAATTTANLATEKERLARIDKAKQELGAATDQASLDQGLKNVIAAGGKPAEVAGIPRMYSPAAMDAYNSGLQTSRERAELAGQAAGRAQTAAHDKVMERQGAARLRLEQQRLNLLKQSEGAFAGMLPQDRARAETAYSKDSKDYTDAVSAARGLQDLIGQAQAGNTAAPALIPIAELRGYVNRVNQAELKGVSSQAGNAFDRVQGWLNSATEGQPIPPAVLKDMVAVSQANEQSAHRKYLGRLAVNKATFGASPPPIDVEAIYGGGAAPAAPPAIARPRAVDAQGNAVEWDGKQWTPVPR
jgi:hypothetical protein